MSDADWSDVFVGGFVLIALAFMVIKSWIMVTSAVSKQLFGESDPDNPSLLPYIGLAVMMTFITFIILVVLQKFTSINLERK